MELETVPEIKTPYQMLSYNVGWQSAVLTIASHGIEWTTAYFNDKMRYSKAKYHDFSTETASYWSGYRAALQSKQESTDATD